RMPSEYWRTNCAVAASFLHREDCARRSRIGVDHIMWGSDYPHLEGTAPFSHEAIRMTFAGVPEPELRAMLGGNAAEIYGFEFDDELAERQRVVDERRAQAEAAGDFVGDAEFQEEWFGEDEEGNSLHEVGLRGGWDAGTRDRELDRDGVTAEVVFPGPDAVTGSMGAPFGAGFNPIVTHSPDHLL